MDGQEDGQEEKRGREKPDLSGMGREELEDNYLSIWSAQSGSDRKVREQQELLKQKDEEIANLKNGDSEKIKEIMQTEHMLRLREKAVELAIEKNITPELAQQQIGIGDDEDTVSEKIEALSNWRDEENARSFSTYVRNRGGTEPGASQEDAEPYTRERIARMSHEDIVKNWDRIPKEFGGGK